MELTPSKCPHCGHHARFVMDRARVGYEQYELEQHYYVIRCNSCGAQSRNFNLKPLSDFTEYTVQDFRGNPILRAKVQDEYEEYRLDLRKETIEAWNRRVI